MEYIIYDERKDEHISYSPDISDEQDALTDIYYNNYFTRVTSPLDREGIRKAIHRMIVMEELAANEDILEFWHDELQEWHDEDYWEKRRAFGEV